MKEPKYVIIPLNEGQRLNYREPSFAGKKVTTERAREMKRDLKKSLPTGTITIIIMPVDKKGWYTDRDSDGWVI